MEGQLSDFGIVGLGKIGGGLARQALEKGMRVVGYDPAGVPEGLTDEGLVGLSHLSGFQEALEPPRVIFLYVPAGPTVDQVLEDLIPVLDDGDVIADGGDSYWGDSIRRYEDLRERELSFCDVGTSGGVEGARRGASFMAGGEKAHVAQLEPILQALSVDGGYVHAGPPGSGHFVKLVHNGIEFGMLQAIGEGVNLLESFPQSLPVAEILRCWRNGSVIRSWLVDLMEEGYRRHGDLEAIPPFVEDTGEVNWLLADALEMEAAIPIISQAVSLLFLSRDEQKYWARAVAVMRQGFGEHPYEAHDPRQKKPEEG